MLRGLGVPLTRKSNYEVTRATMSDPEFQILELRRNNSESQILELRRCDVIQATLIFIIITTIVLYSAPSRLPTQKRSQMSLGQT